jgi:hypothetical protein
MVSMYYFHSDLEISKFINFEIHKFLNSETNGYIRLNSDWSLMDWIKLYESFIKVSGKYDNLRSWKRGQASLCYNWKRKYQLKKEDRRKFSRRRIEIRCFDW